MVKKYGNQRRRQMAKRIYFKSTPLENKLFEENFCEFKYYSGFAVSQKQKSIADLHKNILLAEPEGKILEVSTKSPNPLGIRLSAFNLKFYDEFLCKEFFLENIFQSAKAFEHGGPYEELLQVSPRDAKRDDRLKTSGKLIGFYHHSKLWPLSPPTMFYDWIYMTALSMNDELSNKAVEYNIFTDIEFNHEKSLNCQARAVAIYVSLKQKGILREVLQNNNLLSKVYTVKESNAQQALF